jgi:6-pyruvoyltetrahydropterin/6-carboxytetrahydropterin synthase
VKEVTLSRKFRFEAAHFLPRVPEGHKCRRMHGHSFRFEVFVHGPLDPELGWLIDYADITAVVEPIRKLVDHNLLNEVEGLENPTSEVLAVWLWDRIKPNLPLLSRIVVYETCNSHCSYEGPA